MSIRRDHGIEGLRGLAAFAVMIGHIATLAAGVSLSAELAKGTEPTLGDLLSGQTLALLTHGVTLFFVLSGYLLYRPFALQLLGGEREPSIRSFYRNRMLRIFPAYVVILLFCGWVLGSTTVTGEQLGGGPDAVERSGYLTDPLHLLASLTLLHGYFPSTFNTGVNPSWSLVPELAFYAVLPLTWLLTRRLAGRGTRAALLPPLLLIAIGLVGFTIARDLLVHEGEHAIFAATWPAVVFHSFPATCQLFGFGMLVAVLVARLGAPDAQPSAVRRARRVSVTVLVLCGLAYLPSKLLVVDELTVGIACSALVLLTVAPGGGRIRTLWVRFLESRPLENAGLISYSVYLWHFPLTLFLLREIPALGYSGLGGFLLVEATVISVTLLLSAVTYHFVEKPALARKRSMVDAPPEHHPVPSHRA